MIGSTVEVKEDGLVTIIKAGYPNKIVTARHIFEQRCIEFNEPIDNYNDDPLFIGVDALQVRNEETISITNKLTNYEVVGIVSYDTTGETLIVPIEDVKCAY